MTEDPTLAELRPRRTRVFVARVLTDLGLVLGGALALAALYTVVQDHGGLAYDTHAYWLAARNVLDGAPLYQSGPYSALGLYTYPPVFAQLFTPAAPLPELVVTWAWRVTGVLSLRYLVGSWKATVVSCCFVPVLTELAIGNVTLQLAACILFALRDRRGAYVLPWAVALKFGPALVVPYLWLRRPRLAGPSSWARSCSSPPAWFRSWFLRAPGPTT